MNGTLPWIAAQEDRLTELGGLPAVSSPAEPPVGPAEAAANLGNEFELSERSGGEIAVDSPEAGDDPLDRNPELRLYRGRTIGMLRRYMRYSLETGRLPSLLGRELFRARVTSYTVATFEDRVILVHDMETSLQKLREFSRQLIARYFLQEHDLVATARLLHCNEKTIRRTIPMALDELSEILLEIGLLAWSDSVRQKSCQEGETGQISASDCKEGENKGNYILATQGKFLHNSRWGSSYA